MSELDFYPLFAEQLKMMGYDEIYTQVRIHGNLETDVVGLKHFKRADTRAIAIEVKENDVDKVISQAVIRKHYFNKVYGAICLRKDEAYLGFIFYKISQRFALLAKEEIGFLIYDEARQRVFEITNAKFHKASRLHEMLASLPAKGVEQIA